MEKSAYIGVGSNIGDTVRNCLAGIRAVISDERATFIALSSLYRTSPVSPIPQNDFINAVLKIEWNDSPSALLLLLNHAEAELGREREVRFGPRTIDLDILLFGTVIMKTPQLTIPHPRFHERRFALVPMLEIDPNLVHPLLKRSLSEFLTSLDADQTIERVRKATREELGL